MSEGKQSLDGVADDIRRLAGMSSAKRRQEVRASSGPQHLGEAGVHSPVSAGYSSAELAENELDVLVEECLSQVPVPRPSSNFTARVLDDVRHIPAGEGMRAGEDRFVTWWRRWMVPVAAGFAAMAFTLIVVQQNVSNARAARKDLARRMVEAVKSEAIPGSGESPSSQVWQDFEAVRLLPAVARPDDVALLHAMQ